MRSYLLSELWEGLPGHFVLKIQNLKHCMNTASEYRIKPECLCFHCVIISATTGDLMLTNMLFLFNTTLVKFNQNGHHVGVTVKHLFIFRNSNLLYKLLEFL